MACGGNCPCCKDKKKAKKRVTKKKAAVPARARHGHLAPCRAAARIGEARRGREDFAAGAHSKAAHAGTRRACLASCDRARPA